MDRYLKLFLIFSWSLLVFVIISQPFPETEVHAVRETWHDKSIHLVLFFVFAGLSASLVREFARFFRTIFFVSIFSAFVFASAAEIYQIFVPGREANELDLLAGFLGALLGALVYWLLFWRIKPKLLLHICCIGCGAYVSRLLEEEYDITLFFYNPNIYPKKEYQIRLSETERVAKEFGWPVFKGVYSHKNWLKKIKGFEKEKERGARCDICYFDRLEKTVKLARKEGFKFFTSTLSISPYKNAKKISEIGNDLEQKYGVKFFDQDFKKKDGFKKSVELSRKLNLYRQNYCGCEFSRRTFVPTKSR